MHAGICYKLFLDVHGDAVSLYACSDFFLLGSPRSCAMWCRVFCFFCLRAGVRGLRSWWERSA
jgi:hypothetical protein